MKRTKKPVILLLCVPALATITGCSAIHPAQIGQAVGAIVGSAIAPGIGTQLGSLVGTLAGMLTQGQIDKATEKKERKTLNEEFVKKPDSAAAAEAVAPASGTPARVWVDETLQNGQVIAGRFETRLIP